MRRCSCQVDLLCKRLFYPVCDLCGALMKSGKPVAGGVAAGFVVGGSLVGDMGQRSVGLQEPQQLVQLRCHDNLGAAVVGASLGCLVGVDGLVLTASAGLYLQGVHAVGLGEDAHYAGGSNDAQVPVVLEDSRVDGHFVGVSFDIDVYLRLRVEHLRQLS